MNVQRCPRCTFILPQDVPRGRETVGTTPPPLLGPQNECATPRQTAPPSDTPGTATGTCSAHAVRHTAEHFAQRVTDCAQSDLDSSPSAQNVTLCTKCPCTPLPPTRPGTLGVGPLAHVEDGSHPHNQEPRLPTDRPHHPARTQKAGAERESRGARGHNCRRGADRGARRPARRTRKTLSPTVPDPPQTNNPTTRDLVLFELYPAGARNVLRAGKRPVHKVTYSTDSISPQSDRSCPVRPIYRPSQYPWTSERSSTRRRRHSEAEAPAGASGDEPIDL